VHQEAPMTTTKIFGVVFAAIAFLAGCTSMPPPAQVSASPCALHEYSYACQVERYQRVP
jgi:hypothetical protein